MTTFAESTAAIDQRAAWSRGFINDPVAGDQAARLGLTRTRALLDALDAPDRRLELVHIAGSKGKGSTAVFTHSILSATGSRTGLFTSPHLVDYRDRMVIGGDRISETQFAETADSVAIAIGNLERDQPDLGTCTAFEMLFAMAVVWFVNDGCDTGVIEVGMGGLLDATNVITPAISVITHLELEHTAILGPTLKDIAINKAGIIKPHVPCVCASQLPEAMAIIRDRARTQESSLSVVGESIHVSSEGDAWTVTDHMSTFSELRPRLQGMHQAENLALAVAAYNLLRHGKLETSDVQRGVATAWLPGRMDVRRLANGATIVIDGAHTVDSMAALTQWVRARRPKGEVLLIIGMLNDKDPREVLAPLLPVVDRIIAVPVHSPRGIAPADLANAVRPKMRSVAVRVSIQEVLSEINDLRSDAANVVIVAGSLTLAAEVYRYIG